MRLLPLRLLLIAVAWFAAGPSAALTYQFSTPISGDVVPVTVNLEDVPGGVDLTVSIAPGSGDLLGFFGSVVPESLVPQLSVANPTGVVTQWQFQANAVWKVGGGNTMAPVKTFDFGLKLGQTGGGGGALTSASFGLRAPGLTVASITGASTQGWVLGVRIQGTSGLEGSSKLGLAVGTPPVSEPPTIAITSPEEGALLPTSAVPVAGTVTGAGVAVEVGGTPASVGGGSFEATLTLEDGSHTLVATATNAAGSASDSVSITVDTTPPVVTITAPADATQTTEASILVTGTVADASPIVSFTVNGTPAALAPDGSFAVTVPLALGPQAITASATDAAGHPGSAFVSVTRGEAPAVAIASPVAGALLAASPVTVSGTVSGTEPIGVVVNGVAATVAGGSFTASIPLVEGANTLTATATNAFGEASASTPVTLDTTPPVVTITSPANGSLTAEASTSVTGTVFDASPIASLTVNGVVATLTGSAFSASVPLAEGANPITATATDAAGHSGSDVISVTRGNAPTITVASPAEGFETGEATILVSGPVSGTEPLLVSVNGVPATVSGGSYSATVPLVEGANTLTATATNALGSASANVSGTRIEGAPPLTISIATPPNGAFVSKETVAVAGLVSNPQAQVTVNGAPAIVTGTGYVAAAVPLEEGPNPLVALATRGAETAEAQAEITYNAPPRVVITSPPDGETLRTETTDVSGLVDDPTAFVDVNGVSARVEAGGRFVAEAMPLSPGENPLRARAIDLYGAEGSDETIVMRDEGAAPRLRIVLADPQRPPFPTPGAFDGSRVWETLLAEGAEEFRAGLEAEGYELARFEPAVALPAIGRRFGSPGVYAFLFAEEIGSGTVTLEGTSAVVHYSVEVDLQPIELLPDDLVFQFGNLDLALLGELIPEDFEPRYYARLEVDLSFGDGGPDGFFVQPYEATSGLASDRLDVLYDFEAPGGQITSPAGGVVAGGSVTVTGWFESEGAPLYGEVQYEVLDEIGTRIGEGTAPLVSGQFTLPPLALGAGLYCVAVAPIDAAGNSEYANTCFESDPDAPAAALVSPQDGEAVLDASVGVDLNFAAPTTLLAVNGAPDGRSFPAGFAGGALTLPLALGPNVFTLDLEVGGTVFQLSFTLFRVDALGEVRITSPGEGSLLNTPTVTVRGTAPRGTPLVEVNGIPAAIAADGVSFEATGVPLREGPNPLRAVAYPLGREALVTVTGDFTPPHFLAFVPEDGTGTTAPEVTLAGFLSEAGSLSLQGPGGEAVGTAIFAGTLGSGPFATARYRFDLGPLALGPGPNALVLRATDGAGNVAEETFTLTRSDGALLFAAPTAPVPALRADVTLEALEPVTLLAWYAEGRRVPAVEGGNLTPGFVPVPNIPLLPGANAMRVVYQRAGGGPEMLTFEVESSATEVAVVEGVVTDTATGLPVAGALVQITVNGLTLAVVTDAEGRYRAEVEPGAFVVAAMGEGYAAGGASGTGTGGGTTVADVGLAPTGLPGIQNQVAIVVPPDGTVTDFEQLTVVGTVLNPGSVVTVNGVPAEVIGNRFTARHVPLAMGANTLQVTASALGSPVATHSVAVERAAEPVLAVKIYSPPDDVRIPGGGLVLRAFVSAKQALVAMEGQAIAIPDEGIVTVYDVLPGLGRTSLEVRAETDGASASDAVLVESTSTDRALALSASPSSGAPPLDVGLDLTSAVELAGLRRIDFDTDGDGDLDVIGSPTSHVSTTLDVARTHVARVFATLASAAELTASSHIGVFLPPVVIREFAQGNPVDLATGPDGTLYVLDGAAGRVTRYRVDGTPIATYGASGSGADQLSNPQALDVASDGRVYVADTGNGRVQVYGPAGAFERTIGASGTASGQFRSPKGLAIDGETLVVADTGNARIQILGLDGTPRVQIPISDPRGLSAASSAFLAASPSVGVVSVSERLTELPEQLSVLPPQARFAAPVDVAAAPDGVLVADAGRSQVVQLSPQLSLRRVVDALPGIPRAVATSFRGEIPAFFVADGARVTEIGLPAPSPLATVEALKERLAQSDVEGAVALIHPQQRDHFRALYQRIAPDLPLDAGVMQSFSIAELREERAIVRIYRSDQPPDLVFPIHLIRAEDGGWWIFDY